MQLTKDYNISNTVLLGSKGTNFSFKEFFKFTFRERGRGVEREGEKHQCVVASHTPPPPPLEAWPTNEACALTGD